MLGLSLGIPFGTMYLSEKIYQVITNKYITKNKIFLFLGVMGLALLAAQIIPPKGWDLYRHYEEIDRIRDWGASYAWKDGRYAGYYGTTLLFYITSLTPWNGFLPFITILIELLLFEKVMAHYKNQLRAQNAGMCFFLFLVLSNIVMAISGIRNVLATTLVNYAIWDFECVSKKRLLADAAIALFAITIHPASGFLVAIYAVSYIPLRLVGVAISIFILPILTGLLSIFTSNENAMLSSSSSLFALYIKEQAGLDIRVKTVSVILIVFSIIVALRVLRREKTADRYLYFVILYSLGTLGMLPQGLVYSRMLYGLNILYPMLITRYCTADCGNKTIKLVYWYKVYCLIYCMGMLAFQGYELIRAIVIK